MRVLIVGIDRLRTSFSHLRGSRTCSSSLAELPIRVTEVDAGHYEIIDGFKRFARWRSEGQTEIAVVVEPVSGCAVKASMLAANSPGRSVSPMDEAHVIVSFRHPCRAAEAERFPGGGRPTSLDRRVARPSRRVDDGASSAVAVRRRRGRYPGVGVTVG